MEVYRFDIHGGEDPTGKLTCGVKGYRHDCLMQKLRYLPHFGTNPGVLFQLISGGISLLIL